MAASAMVLNPKPAAEPPASFPSTRSDLKLSDQHQSSDEDDLYRRLKSLQRQLEFIDIQEEYVKDEQKNLKRELLRAQEEVKRIQSVPLVIGQFMEMVDQNNGIVGSTTGSNYYSGFEGFIRDKYTALPDTRERILATEITASWRKPLYFTERYLNVKKVLTDTFYGPPKEGIYSPSVQSTLYDMAKTLLKSFPDIAAVQLKMPNLHFLPVNLSNKDGTIVKFEDDVYIPTDEPHGSIQATLSRLWSKM